MHTQIPQPILSLGAATQLPQISLNAPAPDNNQFQQALAREMDQRAADNLASANSGNVSSAPKAADKAPTPAAASQPAPAQAPAAPSQNDSDQSSAASAPTTEAASASAAAAPANSKSSGTSGTAATSAASGKDKSDDGKSDTQAAMDGPVANMLALVAAFNQPAAAGAATAAGASAAAAIDPHASAAALKADPATLAALPAGAAAAAAATAGSIKLDPVLAQAVGSDDGKTTKQFSAALTQAGSAAAAVHAATAGATAALTSAQPVDAASLAAMAARLQPAADASTADATGQKTVKVDALADGKAIDTDKADAGDKTAAKPAVSDTTALQTAQSKQATADAGSALAAKAEGSAGTPVLAVKELPAAVTGVAAPTTQASLAVAQAAAATSTDTLSARVGSSAWDEQLSQKVVFLAAAGGDQTATMDLNPPDLGPLQVVLSVSADQATAAFTSNQPEVRQALEAAMPKLRDMMSDAGIQLGNATVSAGMSNQSQSFNQQAGSAQSGGNGGAGPRYGNNSNSGNDSGTEVTVRAAPRRVALGAVDTFA